MAQATVVALRQPDDAPKHIGRPCLLTPELQEAICGFIARGNYVSTACQAVGIGTTTLSEWRQRGEAGEAPYAVFGEAVKRATAEAEARIVGMVLEHVPTQWAAGMTWLERKFPDRWGRHDRVDHELSQQGMELLQRLREIGERPAVAGPLVEGEARELTE